MINIELLFSALINHPEHGVVFEAGTFQFFCVKINHKATG